MQCNAMQCNVMYVCIYSFIYIYTYDCVYMLHNCIVQLLLHRYSLVRDHPGDYHHYHLGLQMHQDTKIASGVSQRETSSWSFQLAMADYDDYNRGKRLDFEGNYL